MGIDKHVELSITDEGPLDLNSYAYVLNNPILYFDPDGEAPQKYKKPPNPNKRKGSDERAPTGDRERNVGHPDAEEHSRRPKGNRPPRRPRGPIRGLGPAGLIDPLLINIVLWVF